MAHPLKVETEVLSGHTGITRSSIRRTNLALMSGFAAIPAALYGLEWVLKRSGAVPSGESMVQVSASTAVQVAPIESAPVTKPTWTTYVRKQFGERGVLAEDRSWEPVHIPYINVWVDNSDGVFRRELPSTRALKVPLAPNEEPGSGYQVKVVKQGQPLGTFNRVIVEVDDYSNTALGFWVINSDGTYSAIDDLTQPEFKLLIKSTTGDRVYVRVDLQRIILDDYTARTGRALRLPAISQLIEQSLSSAPVK